MLTITKDINVVSVGQRPVINLSQYDSDFTLVFNLYASMGAFTMPSGTTAQIQGTKTDGNGYSAAASVSGNTVTVTGHVQMTAAAGPNVYEIAIFNGEKRLSTINFILMVERAALDSDTVSSESVIKDLSNIPEAVEQAEAAADRAEEAARTLTIDQTLTQSGQAADAKVTGDEINDLKEDLRDISVAVETLIPETLTLSVGLMNKYGQETSTTAYEHGLLQVAPQERYQIDAFYYGGNFPAVVFLNGSTVVSFINGTGDRTEYADIVTVPNNADTMVVNGRVADFRAEASRVVEKKVLKIQSGSAVEVGKDASRYEYTDINTAIINNADSIVLVDYGTYETEIQNLATNKRIIGKDVDLCILNGTNKDYDTPPIEIAGGIVKNFTVNMINAESAEHKGYCLHSDNANTKNNTLLVDNCKFKCTGQHAVGIGLRPDETLIFENCYFEQLDEGADLNPIYIHNGAGTNPAIVKFHNCYFRGHEYCMKLQGWGSGNDVRFEFINCTCLSDIYGVSDSCVWTDYASGSTHDTNRLHEFSGKFTLLPTSHGNNIAVLNSN